VRTNLSKELGFSREDKDRHIRRVGYVAHLLSRNGVAVICATISPCKAVREENRRLIGNFIEVYVKASVEICSGRDVKGLYKKAFAGKVRNFAGVSDPYEPPEYPEVICETETESIADCKKKILTQLENMGYLLDNSNVDKDEKLKERLKGLGYL
jgi:adenylylsulfate kinase